jgi:hypothetical protein
MFVFHTIKGERHTNMTISSTRKAVNLHRGKCLKQKKSVEKAILVSVLIMSLLPKGKK